MEFKKNIKKIYFAAYLFWRKSLTNPQQENYECSGISGLFKDETLEGNKRKKIKVRKLHLRIL